MNSALNSASNSAAMNSTDSESPDSAMQPAASSMTAPRATSAQTISQRGPYRSAMTPPPSSMISRGRPASARNRPALAGLVCRISVQVSAMYQAASPSADRLIAVVNPR